MKRTVLLLPLLLLVGCGGVKKDDYVGSWAGTLQVSDSMIDKMVEQSKAATGGISVDREQIRAFMEAGATLDLIEDDSFQLSLGPVSYGGKWSFVKESVTLTVDTVMGKPIDEAIDEFKIDSETAASMRQPTQMKFDKETGVLSGSSPGDAGSTFTFTKQEKSEG